MGGPGRRAPGRSERKIIRQWSAIYDVIYEPMPYHGAGPDYSGWRSSITGENYSDDAMDEWVHGTVSEILGLGGAVTKIQ